MPNQNQILRTNPFDGIKYNPRQRTKLSDIIRENAYNDIINRIGFSMFEWTGLPDELDSEQMERAINCGAAVVFRVPVASGSASKGMYVCAPLEWVGVMKADNTADKFIAHIPYGDFAIESEQLKGKYVIVRNNFENSCEYAFTEWTANMLNETDISENQLIKWSRMTPVAKVTSDADIGKFENVLQRVYNGEPYAVISDYTKIITNSASTRDDNVLRLTDETAIEKMHFLSEFHYELIRRICNLYNIPFHTTAKSAQNLESELHNTDIFSQMLTTERMKWRKKSIADFKRVFGWDVSVELGEKFRKEDEVIENIIESTNPETTETQETKETQETTETETKETETEKE